MPDEPAPAPHPRDLFLAIRHCDLAEVERQLALGADPNWKNRAAESALVYAAFARNPDVVRLLLAHGATDDGKMPFEEAVVNYSGEDADTASSVIVEFFLQQAAVTVDLAREGAIPLLEAAGAGDVRSVQLFLAHGAGVNAKWVLENAAIYKYEIPPEITTLLQAASEAQGNL